MKNPSTDDTNDVATQIIQADCHRLATDDGFQGEEGDDVIHLSSTMPIDDDYLLEDGFETQLVNHTGGTQSIDYFDETQVMDDVGETQVMDDVGETQVMDDTGETQVMNFSGEAQVMDYAGDETQKIDCDGETQDLGDVISMKSTSSECSDKSIAHGDAVNDNATKMHDDVCGTSPVTFCNEGHSGSARNDFTSIRTASFRASGLAARARGPHRAMFSFNTDKSSLEQRSCIQGSSSFVGRLLQYGTGNVEDLHQNEDSNGNGKPEIANNYKFGNKVVRKLFLDDQDSERVQSEAEINLNNHLDDYQVDNQISSQNHLAGLSYANSQEPGDLSQAEALKVVDKFLSANAENINVSFGFRVHNAEKPKAVSTAKGSRDLAKVSISKRINKQKGIYDWDANSEDECGGEFFLKKKELFFDCDGPKQRNFNQPRKRKGSYPECVKNVTAHGNEEKHTKEKSTDAFHSGSKSTSRKAKAKRKTTHSEEEMLPKNLSKKVEELETAAVLRLADDDSINKETIDQIETIGPDTQIAAEAMENLYVEVQLAGNTNIAAHNKVRHSTAKASKKRRSATKGGKTDECIRVEEQHCSNKTGVVTRLAKRRKSASTSSINECSVPSKKSKNVVKRSREETVYAGKDKRAKVDVTTCHGAEPTGQLSEKKPHLDKQPVFTSPVANRTRNRSQISCSKAADDSSNGARVSRKQRTSTKYKNADSGTARKVREFGSVGFKKSSKSRVATSKASDVDAIKAKQNGEITGAETFVSSGKAETSGKLEASPRDEERCQTSALNCNTPPTCATTMNNVSPICMGDEYHKQSCRKNLLRPSLVKEFNNFVVNQKPENYARRKDLRKRKDIANVRVLFSQHLDDDIVKQQKKILARLGGTVASSVSDATHFVADEFVRTKNMLEAIALGKSVVTHLWLDSCGQASCLIDEKNYILRDAKKEREFGFSLPASLSKACQHPLLQGFKVYITPNTKPGKDILVNLAKAVNGRVVRLGRSIVNDEKHPDDLLVLSCEDDYDICIPFLKKGGSVYSSELLLNGIVKQKLEFARHRLFADNVKRTRSTIWLKNNNQYLPVQ